MNFDKCLSSLCWLSGLPNQKENLPGRTLHVPGKCDCRLFGRFDKAISLLSISNDRKNSSKQRYYFTSAMARAFLSSCSFFFFISSF